MQLHFYLTNFYLIQRNGLGSDLGLGSKIETEKYFMLLFLVSHLITQNVDLLTLDAYNKYFMYNYKTLIL